MGSQSSMKYKVRKKDLFPVKTCQLYFSSPPGVFRQKILQLTRLVPTLSLSQKPNLSKLCGGARSQNSFTIHELAGSKAGYFLNKNFQLDC